MGVHTSFRSGPHFLGRGIAEEDDTPDLSGFYRYVAWARCYLVPLYALLSVSLLGRDRS